MYQRSRVCGEKVRKGAAEEPHQTFQVSNFLHFILVPQGLLLIVATKTLIIKDYPIDLKNTSQFIY